MPAAFLDDPSLFLLLFGGSFVPYAELGAELSAVGTPNPCENYASHDAYLAAVKRAAKYAVRQRWILANEIDPIVAAAEKKAGQYAGCVPAS